MRAIAFMVVLSMALLSTAVLAGEVATQATRTQVSGLAPAKGSVSEGAKTDVPGLMSYQGILTDDGGVALDDTLLITFSIYASSSGGSALWTETQPVIVREGLFNALLGWSNAIPDTVFSDPERWLGVKVGGDPELVPRQRIAAVGYAFRAAESDTSNYARSAAAASDGDWTIVGNDMYSAVSGDVGIGTMSPNAKLDVSGAINSDADYKISDYTVLETTGGFDNIHVGVGAGGSSTGDYNTFVGRDAGPINQGNYNTFLGYTTGFFNTTGHSNTFVGLSTGYDNTTGSYNTFLGRSAGQNNTTGNDNTFVGRYAGFFNETGNYNTFLGMNAGLNSTGTSNTFIGHYTGYDNTGGNYNTFVGRYGGLNNTTGSTNVSLGYAAGLNNSTGGGNVFLGTYAGYYETGSNKLYIANGMDSSRVLIYGDFLSGNVGIGTLSPVSMLDVGGDVNADLLYRIGGDAVLSVEGTENTLVGVGAGANNTGSWGTFVGYHAGHDNQANQNTFIGQDAGSVNTTGEANTFLGQLSGAANTSGNSNTFLGQLAGAANTSGHNNTFLGRQAGTSHTTGYLNTFVGRSAGNSNITASLNTFVGGQAGYSNTYGYENTFVGSNVGYNNTEGIRNTFLGHGTGYHTTTGSYNTFVGQQAGNENTTGGSNTYLGQRAGSSNTTGILNVFLGYQAGQYETGSNKLYIASGADTNRVLIYGDFSTGRVGLGTLDPAQRLDVVGNVQVSDRVLVGTPSQDGYLELYRDGTADPIIEMGDYWNDGGSFYVRDSSGTTIVYLEPDIHGDATYLTLAGGGSWDGFEVDGNYSGTGDPRVSINGASRSAVFNMSSSGNNSVSLPTGAIYDVEIWDEPGAASNTNGLGSVVLTGGIDVLLSRSLTCPTSGYVLAMGTCEVTATHTTGTTSNANFGVSDDGTAFPANQDIELRLNSALPSGDYDFPVTVQGLFQVSAGANTFYFLAQESSGSLTAYDMQVSLIFVPTAYGTVSPTLAEGPSIPDDRAQKLSPLTLGDIAAERAEAEAFNAARIERELAIIRAELEAVKQELGNPRR